MPNLEKTYTIPEELKTDAVDIALIGNPNTGKTSVFNALTGLRHKVGNYPGVTVEKKIGILKSPSGLNVRVYDLPGLYSLIPKSLDDKIAVDILLGRLQEAPNLKLVVVVADAGNLWRNLYLVTQVIDVGLPVILALNMMDVARTNGMQINVEELSAELGIPVVPLVASRQEGIPALRDVIIDVLESGNHRPYGKVWQVDKVVEETITPIREWFRKNFNRTKASAQSLAIRVLSNDTALEHWVEYYSQKFGPRHCELPELVQNVRESLKQNNIDWHMLEAKLRYKRIEEICKKAVIEEETAAPSFSEKVDRILTHRIFGPIIFLIIFAVIFQSIFTWAEIPMNAIENFIQWFSDMVRALLPDGILQDLIVDGAIAGVGAILVFLPQILFLFFFLSLLEDTGYLARVAFIMDRLLKPAGLSG
ncbi:MAG: FeoB small GTPase domain-containing protein, partial [Calditrichia bacterium]